MKPSFAIRLALVALIVIGALMLTFALDSSYSLADGPALDAAIAQLTSDESPQPADNIVAASLGPTGVSWLKVLILMATVVSTIVVMAANSHRRRHLRRVRQQELS